MYCRECGAFIKRKAFRCENCGIGIFPLIRYKKINRISFVGLVVSIISFFFSLYGLTGVAGIIISCISLKQIDRFIQKGKIVAISGILIGIISVIYTLFI